MRRNGFSNPFLSKLDEEYIGGPVASYGGVVSKILFFVLLTLGGVALFLYNPFIQYNMEIVIGVAIIAIIFPFIISFAPKTIPITGSIYSIAQGYVVGFLCYFFEKKYQGIVTIAILITLVTFLILLFLYSTGVIKVGRRFKAIVWTLVLTTIVFSGIVFISSFFTPILVNIFYGNSYLAIGVSAILTVIAALNLITSLDNITVAINNKLPKKVEWQVAFGLIMAIILLFVRILELLARIMGKSKEED